MTATRSNRGAIVRDNGVRIQPFMHASDRFAPYGPLECPTGSFVEVTNDAPMAVMPFGAIVLKPLQYKGWPRCCMRIAA